MLKELSQVERVIVLAPVERLARSIYSGKGIHGFHRIVPIDTAFGSATVVVRSSSNGSVFALQIQKKNTPKPIVCFYSTVQRPRVVDGKSPLHSRPGVSNMEKPCVY